MKPSDEAKRSARMAAHAKARAEAIAAIEKLAGPGPVPLDQVARFIPDNPEWDEHRPRPVGRPRRGS